MELIIHRGAKEVGGSCIELISGKSCIIIDVGLPLSFVEGDSKNDFLPQPLFNDLLSGKTKPDAVFLSHAHLDHYGLVSFLPSNIPMYFGKTTQKLMELSSLLSHSKNPSLQVTHFRPKSEIKIGPFTIIPHLMDHSAIDAYAFLIEAEGKTLFYTGDFRGHGRKKRLFEEFIQNPPAIDVLMMEGTMVGPRSDEAFFSESKLEEAFTDVMQKCEGTVFVTAASQNIDRLVTIFKATKRSKRKFIIDLYTAEVLDSLTDYPHLPKTFWPGIRVAYSKAIITRLENAGKQDIVEKHRQNGIRWPRINEKPHEFVVLCRPGVFAPIKKYLDIRKSAWVYSMWPGYLDLSGPLRRMKSYFDDKGVEYHYIHSGGHALLSDLKRFVKAVKPGMIIPIHTYHIELFHGFFGKVKMVEDGERARI
jgi:ribonuclease J